MAFASCLVITLSIAPSARAEAPASPPPAATSVTPPEAPRRVTLMLGVLSVPRPLGLEAIVRLGERVDVGLSAGYLPKITIADPYAISWLAIDLEGRAHPFRGSSLLLGDSFFVGMNLGYQAVTASNHAYFGGAIAYTTYGLFAAPRAGWMWTLRSGLALGVDLGVAIPVLPGTSIDPPDSASVNTRKVSHSFGQNPMPYSNLFRIGYSF